MRGGMQLMQATWLYRYITWTRGSKLAIRASELPATPVILPNVIQCCELYVYCHMYVGHDPHAADARAVLCRYMT